MILYNQDSGTYQGHLIFNLGHYASLSVNKIKSFEKQNRILKSFVIRKAKNNFYVTFTLAYLKFK